VILADPEADAVNVAWQLATPTTAGTTGARVQGEVMPKEPMAMGDTKKLTVPVGVTGTVGEGTVSMTMAVHVEGWLTTTGLVQLTSVLVGCATVAGLTVMVFEVVGPLPA
jgi:hypothetical protein